MFEKLLEKLLLTYFGTYVHGIDPNNLHVGIWSGDIKI
jgi:vacuolar protein sorting-associated protein 13A/C